MSEILRVVAGARARLRRLRADRDAQQAQRQRRIEELEERDRLARNLYTQLKQRIPR